MPSQRGRRGGNRPQSYRGRNRGGRRPQQNRRSKNRDDNSTAIRIPRNNNNIVPTVRMAQMPLFGIRSKHKSLPYYTNNTLSIPSTSAAVSYVYSANGLYDPDISGTGNQPMGFDQMMIFYDQYVVKRCVIEVTFRNFTTGTSPIVYIAARGDVVNVPSAIDVMEQGNSVSVQLLPANVAGSMQKLSMVIDIAKFLGFDDIMDSNVARGDIASNPAEGAFFHVGAFNNETLASGTLQFQVRLRYLAVFTEPRVITPSLSRAFTALLLTKHDSEENKLDSDYNEINEQSLPPQINTAGCRTN